MSGEYATFLATGPAWSDGRPFLDYPYAHADPVSSRLVIEMAPIYDGDVPGDAVWIDITDKTISAEWDVGATDGSESRWPIGQLVLDCFDLTGLVGDFISFVTTSAATPGAFVRVSMLERTGASTHTWWPQFTGIVDTFYETDKAGPRSWRISAFDVLYWIAGQRSIGTVNIGDDIDSLSNWIEYTLDTVLGVPFDWDIPTSGTENAGGELAAIRNPFMSILHRLADSYGHRLWGYRDGTIRARPWDDIENTTPANIIDELDTTDTTRIYGQGTWTSSAARTASVLHVKGLDGDTDGQQATTSSYLLGKLGSREDAPGWPKLDLLYNDSTVGQALVDDSAPRYATELSLIRVDVDSLRNRHAKPALVAHLRQQTPGDALVFERQAGSVPIVDCMILGAHHRISNFASRNRWQASYFPKITDLEGV